jgi:hypothetical protein
MMKGVRHGQHKKLISNDENKKTEKMMNHARSDFIL